MAREGTLHSHLLGNLRRFSTSCEVLPMSDPFRRCPARACTMMKCDHVVCEARSSTGEPICRDLATHWHTIVPNDHGQIPICEKHACKHCVTMTSEED
jgi:hypothetical protein